MPKPPPPHAASPPPQDGGLGLLFGPARSRSPPARSRPHRALSVPLSLGARAGRLRGRRGGSPGSSPARPQSGRLLGQQQRRRPLRPILGSTAEPRLAATRGRGSGLPGAPAAPPPAHSAPPSPAPSSHSSPARFPRRPPPQPRGVQQGAGREPLHEVTWGVMTIPARYVGRMPAESQRRGSTEDGSPGASPDLSPRPSRAWKRRGRTATTPGPAAEILGLPAALH